MKRNWKYLLMLGILAALSLYLFLSRQSGTYDSSISGFAVKDTGRVEYVSILSAGQQVNLSRAAGYWQVNGMPVRKESIRGLQILISRLEVEAPVSRSLEERIRAGLAEYGTEVRIGLMDGSRKSYRLYFDSISANTFMILEESDTPFRVRVRGYQQNNLAGLFYADYRYWRDNLIYKHLPEDICSVFLQNTANPGRSFHLARNKEGIFEAAQGIVPVSWSPSSAGKLDQYLGYFYNVRFESYLDPSMDTLEHLEDPDFVLNLELCNGERTVLSLFPVYSSGETGERQLNYTVLYARFDPGGDWLVLRYVEIDPLLKQYDYFESR